MGKKDRKVKKDVYSSFCDKHPKHAIEMFCVDCDKVVCVICQATEHKSGDHTKILTIEEASTDCAETKQFLDYEDKLSNVFTREKKILEENNEVNTITNKLKEETESLIEKHKQNLIDLIEKHHRILYEKNQLKYGQSKKRLLSVNEQLCKNNNKTAEIRQEIHDKKESGQNVALFIAMKKSQDNLRQIEIEIEETEKLNFVERYKFQAGHMVGQLLEEEKEFGELLVTASKSPKVPPLELKPPGAFVLPRQSNVMVQSDMADEDEQEVYEPVGEIAKAVSNDDQKTRQKSSPRRGSTQPLNILVTEETNESELLSGDNFKNLNTEKYIALCDFKPRMSEEIEIKTGQLVTVWEKCGDWFRGEASGRYGYFPGSYVQTAENKDPAAPPIAKKPSPDTILQRGSMLEIRTDTITTHYVHRRDIVQTQLPEREQSAHQDPILHIQSCQEKIPVPQQKPEKYIAMWDFEPRTQNEIELKEGNVVTVLEKCNQNWFLAEACGRRGYIPVNYVRKAKDNYVRKAEDQYVRKAEDNNVRKAEDKIKSGGDLTNELETVLLRRRAMSEKSSSEEE